VRLLDNSKKNTRRSTRVRKTIHRNIASKPKKSGDLSSSTAVGMLSDYPVRIGARSSGKRNTQKYEGQHKVGHGTATCENVFGLFVCCCCACDVEQLTSTWGSGQCETSSPPLFRACEEGC